MRKLHAATFVGSSTYSLQQHTYCDSSITSAKPIKLLNMILLVSGAYDFERITIRKQPRRAERPSDAGIRRYCTGPPTDQAVPPGKWSRDQGTSQCGRHGHRAMPRPALLRGTDGRPTAKPTRRMGIKACGLSPMPAREPTEEAMDELANPSNASNQVFLLFLSVGWCVVAYATADANVFSSV